MLTNNDSPTYSKDKPIELLICELDREPHAFWNMMKGEFLPAEDRFQKIAKSNETEYYSILKSIPST